MDLLIVDDQATVVNGLVSGIDWESVGVGRVFKAYNAHEAKEVLHERPIDIMLCDIEMPVEDGLSLLRWVKKNGIPVECIFLTAHADFVYAKEAIGLGGFDYILQPARYEDIECVIARAREEILRKKEQREYSSYGKALYTKKDKLLDGIVRDWCLRRDADLSGILSDLRELEIPITGGSEIYLALLQVSRIRQAAGTGEADAFLPSLSDALTEAFGYYGQKTLLTELDEGLYACVVYPGRDPLIDEQGLVRRLTGLLGALESRFSCQAACYTGGAVCPEAVPQRMACLKQMRNDNVACASRVFFFGEAAESGIGKHDFSHICRWGGILAGGGGEIVRREIRELLDTLSADGFLNAENLKRFYQSFMQTVFSVAEQKNISMQKLYNSGEVLNKSVRAYETVEDMIAFSDCVIDFITRPPTAETEKNLVERVSGYVNDHIQANIRRDDIAKAVYLNPDYMSRLFKKETGVTLKRYIMESKMKEAQALLQTTSLCVSEIAAKVGYDNFSHFSQVYMNIMGRSPSDDRK